MTTVVKNIFSKDILESILSNPEVLQAKETLETTNKVSFSIELPHSIKLLLQTSLGLDLFNVTHIPMRWIKGDTAPHVDSGQSSFENTYLVYLTDSTGSFIIDGISYPIQAGEGYVFSEGLSHKTEGTNTTPRLLLGPMSEQGFPVGAQIYYYPSRYLAQIHSGGEIGYTGGFIIEEKDGINNWRIAVSSTGTSPRDVSYTTGVELVGDGTYYLYPTTDIVTYYYLTEAEANDGLPESDIATSVYYETITTGGYTSWRIASNSSGLSNPSLIYTFEGANTLEGPGEYYLYPAIPCFLEGTKILCQVDREEVYVPIEQLKPGALVKTSRDGYKQIKHIGKGPLQNPGTEERTENRLYKCSPTNYPELKEDLYITGCHSILVDTLTKKQEDETRKHLGQIFITDKKYRLMTFLDEKAEPWNSEGTYTIWHVALEHSDVTMNYGVWANGLLVETCSINFIQNKSNMTLIK